MKSKLLLMLIVITVVSLYSQEYTKVVNPTVAETHKVTALGDVIAKKLMSNLQAELLKAMRSGGAASAIDLCNIKALPLTNELLESDGNIISIRRTSKNYRNPHNKPDSIDLNVLDTYESEWNKNPDVAVKKVLSNQGNTLRYYKAIGIKTLCLNCHGDESKVSEEVKTRLLELYPDDKAVGYKEGDFRGAISITFKEF